GLAGPRPGAPRGRRLRGAARCSPRHPGRHPRRPPSLKVKPGSDPEFDFLSVNQSQGLTPIWIVAELEAAEPTLEALGEAVELARPGAPGVVAVGPAQSREGLQPPARRRAGRPVPLRAPAAAPAA